MYQPTKTHSVHSAHLQVDWDEPVSALTYLTKYGIGCTHIHDSVHLERFTHPPVPALDQDKIRNCYLCGECGFACSSLVELRDHLVRKTAWSNSSLVGCRISCLLDNKEWHEGLVTQYHKSGKHSVEFRAIGEKRWLSMSKMAFYIIERNMEQSIEYKENEENTSCRSGAPIDHSETESWSYFEDISIEFAFAQSVLFKVYGGVVQETGHKTKGHTSLTDRDREIAKTMKGSLLYGELLARGVNKALGPHHLHAASCSVLYDLGMGTGKVLIQAFLQFRNLTYLFGVELSFGRYLVAEDAALKMVNLLGRDGFDVEVVSGSSIKITERHGDTDTSRNRVLHMVCGNMFHLRNIEQADIIMLETEVPQDLYGDLCKLLSKMKQGAHTLTYHDIRKIWTLGGFPFKQLEVNRNLTDRYPTSWSVQRGHHFFLWKKLNCYEIAQGPCSPSKSPSEILQEQQQKETLTPTFHDNRAPVTPVQLQSSQVVSNGCFALSFKSSFFNFFRRQRSITKESDKVIPVNTSQTPLVLEIPCSKTNPQIDSKYNQRIIRNSPRLSPEKCSPQNSSSIINPPPVSSLGKSSLPSLVQPLTNPTAFPHSQYDNSSSFSDPYPINYVHSPVDDPNFDPVIQQLKSRMKSC